MPPPIRKTNFVSEWIDMGPRIPVPKIDWIKNKKLDIAYGNDPLQRYDLYYPEEATTLLPVMVIVHGGGFVHMDKRKDWHLYPGFFALKEGFALISINYRLAPKNKCPTAENDVTQAILHIKKHAVEFGLNADNLCLYGTSAGGNLVSIVGLKGVGMEYSVCAVAALCPFISFKWAYAAVCEKRSTFFRCFVLHLMCLFYLGGLPKRVLDKMDIASAESFIGDTVPPFYLQTGTKDPGIDHSDVIRFHSLLVEKAVPDALVLDLLEGAPHAGAGPDFLELKNILPILEFFKRHTQSKL